MPVPRSIIGGDKTCVLCGGPIQSRSIVGICCRNETCKREHSRVYLQKIYRRRNRATPVEDRQKCNLCGGPMNMGSQTEICTRTLSCSRERSKRYAALHRSNYKEADKRWRISHREVIEQLLAKYRLSNLLDGVIPLKLAHGHLHPNWMGGRYCTCAAPTCYSQIWRCPALIKRSVSGKFFCSLRCYGLWQRGKNRRKDI